MFDGQHDSEASVVSSVSLRKSVSMRVAMSSNTRYFYALDRQAYERRELAHECLLRLLSRWSSLLLTCLVSNSSSASWPPEPPKGCRGQELFIAYFQDLGSFPGESARFFEVILGWLVGDVVRWESAVVFPRLILEYVCCMAGSSDHGALGPLPMRRTLGADHGFPDGRRHPDCG